MKRVTFLEVMNEVTLSHYWDVVHKGAEITDKKSKIFSALMKKDKS
jgi:hypothetical protein